MGLLFREHPKAQPEGGFRRRPGSNLRPLVYKASDLTTAPRRLFLKHHKKNMTMSSFCIPKVLKSATKYLKIGSQIKIFMPENNFE